MAKTGDKPINRPVVEVAADDRNGMIFASEMYHTIDFTGTFLYRRRLNSLDSKRLVIGV